MRGGDDGGLMDKAKDALGGLGGMFGGGQVTTPHARLEWPGHRPGHSLLSGFPIAGLLRIS